MVNCINHQFKKMFIYVPQLFVFIKYIHFLTICFIVPVSPHHGGIFIKYIHLLTICFIVHVSPHHGEIFIKYIHFLTIGGGTNLGFTVHMSLHHKSPPKKMQLFCRRFIISTLEYCEVLERKIYFLRLMKPQILIQFDYLIKQLQCNSRARVAQ